jgi:hypothetical protein
VAAAATVIRLLLIDELAPVPLLGAAIQGYRFNPLETEGILRKFQKVI